MENPAYDYVWIADAGSGFVPYSTPENWIMTEAGQRNNYRISSHPKLVKQQQDKNPTQPAQQNSKATSKEKKIRSK